MTAGPGAALLDRRVEQIIDYLHARQGSDGEFPTLRYFCTTVGDYVTPTEFPEWHYFGKCPFAVANIVYHIAHIDHPKVRDIVHEGCEYLARGLERGGVARYVAGYFQPVYFPADIDDTCLALMVLRAHGYPYEDNRGIILRNRDGRGRFLTWFVPRWRHLASPRDTARLVRDFLEYYGRMRGKPRADKHRILREYWQSWEPAIVTNVVLYLGESRITRRPIASVIAAVERGDVALGYYKNVLFAYFHVARAYAGGVSAFGCLRERIVREMVARQDAQGRVQNGFCTAVAALTLMDFGCWDGEPLAKAIGYLARDPVHEEGWKPIHYCNDLDGVFLDGGAELTAAFYLAALHRYRARLPR